MMGYEEPNVNLQGLKMYRNLKSTFDRDLAWYLRNPRNYGSLSFQLPKDGNVSMDSLDLRNFTCTCKDYIQNQYCAHKVAFELSKKHKHL